MQLHRSSGPLALFLALTSFQSQRVHASPNLHSSLQAGFSYNELFERFDCTGGTLCGFYQQLCCQPGTGCYTGTNQQASCTSQGAVATGGGYYSMYTTTYVMTGFVTTTATLSTYIGGVAPTATAGCPAVQICGGTCCQSGQYCFDAALSQCTAAAFGGTSPGVGTPTATNGHQTTQNPGAPILGTSRGTTVVTATAQTTDFVPPVATGANITTTGQETSSGGGLSGGAIAGIVIGVLAALLLLGLLLFCCCVGTVFEGLFSIFGLGRKRRVTEVSEYERRSHHASGGTSRGRTWWGGAARPPARVEREKNHEVRNALGIVALLGGVWAALGWKRRRDRKKEQERYSEYSYHSSDYTSESSASSDDRRTRRTHDTRYSRR